LFTFIGAENDVLASEVDSLFDNLPYVILLVLRSVVVFVLCKRKRSTVTDPNIISLDKFNFNKRESEIVLEEQRIELTSKEADLLLLLLEAVNTSVERETMLNLVWGDEGDYVGRTLDVFISKLRKKLEADPSIKIVNARSVGYKLMTD
jgi:DNA-binding response OmpR family regulator